MKMNIVSIIGSVLIALLALGMHGHVFGSASAAEAQVISEEADADFFPPAYAFRAMDFDDPVNGY